MLTGLVPAVFGRTASVTTADSAESDPREGQLQAGLKPRHMTMIALGGIIGAGLFVGSSAVIGTVGPGAVMSYLFAESS
jgi:L-asparagine transporter-like permease